MRFRLPEPVLDVPEAERRALTWGNDVLMQVDGVGAFVRVLFPIQLTGGYTVTFGAWLGVHPDGLKHAYELWNSTSYSDLHLAGRLANMLPGWEQGTYRKPVKAKVVDTEHVPVVNESEDPFVARLLREEWPHEEVLARL